MIENLTLISGNLGKVKELGRNLGVELNHLKLDLPEIQSLDIVEVVEYKAKEAYKIVGTPVLVEDTALIFHSMGKLPGTFIKWFIEELDYDGLCRMLDQYDDRSATAYACIGYYDGDRLKTFVGESKGSIAKKPSAQKGFGWDCIFISGGSTETWAEIPPEDKDKVSHRGRAVTKLKDAFAILAVQL